MNTVNICGKEYPVIGMVNVEGLDMHIPLVDMPMMSDYDYQRMCYEDRINNPEKYIGIDEDVNATIARLRKWLESHRKDKTE